MAGLTLSEAEKAELPSLSTSQRAMRAARHATRKQGNPRERWTKALQSPGDETPRIDEAAEAYGVTSDMISLARTVLRLGSEEEIASVDQGRLSVSVLARQIRGGTKASRAAYVENGPNAARVEKIRENAQMWSVVRDAIDKLSGLPRPEDMIPLIRGNDRGHAMQKKFPIALAWMNQLNKAWKESQNA